MVLCHVVDQAVIAFSSDSCMSVIYSLHMPMFAKVPESKMNSRPFGSEKWQRVFLYVISAMAMSPSDPLCCLLSAISPFVFRSCLFKQTRCCSGIGFASHPALKCATPPFVVLRAPSSDEGALPLRAVPRSEICWLWEEFGCVREVSAMNEQSR